MKKSVIFILIISLLLTSFVNINFISSTRYKGKADLALWDPDNGYWFRWGSTDGHFEPAQFGFSACDPIPGDYDGDGITDLAVYWEGGVNFYLLMSSKGFRIYNFGGGIGYKSIPAADYDGDGADDIALYLPIDPADPAIQGRWFFLNSSNNFLYSGTVHFGYHGAEPAPGDYDGDGITDIAVYCPSNCAGGTNGEWSILQSSDGFEYIKNFGAPDTTPVPADYDGDNRTDLAYYNKFGYWSIKYSSGKPSLLNNKYSSYGDTPAPADYDDDGIDDVAWFDPTFPGFVIHGSATGPHSIRYGYYGPIPVVGNWDGDFCTRNQNEVWNGTNCIDGRLEDCSGNLPSNAVYNGGSQEDGKFSQTYDGTEWIPVSKDLEYNETSGECKFKCDTQYLWDSSIGECHIPVDYPPQYVMVNCTPMDLPLNTRYNDDDLNGTFNQTQIWNGSAYNGQDKFISYNLTAGECNFECISDYIYNGTDCEQEEQELFCSSYNTSASCESGTYQNKLIGKKTVDSILNDILDTTGETYCDTNSLIDSSSTCNYTSLDCRCMWNATQEKCLSIYNTTKICKNPVENDMNFGSCSFTTTDIENNCNTTGYLVYTRNAVWSKSGVAPEFCKNSVKQYACPETSELDFFTDLSLIIAIAIIIGIYIYITNKKHRFKLK